MRRAAVPAGSVCGRCGKPAEQAVTADNRPGMLMFCTVCLVAVARELKLTNLLSQLRAAGMLGEEN